MTLLIVLLVMYLLYRSLPLLLGWWLRRKQRQFGEQFDQAREQAARARQRQQSEQRRQQSEQQRHEYAEQSAEDAEYVDISGPREQMAQESYTPEEQVTDAEFQDI